MRLLIVFSMVFMAQITFAAALSDAPEFASPEENARYQQLIKETRCPTCQNSDIGESNAPLARHLREQIAKQIRAGKNDDEIGVFLRDRYGDFITYNPPLKGKTLALWFAPFLIMLAALGWFFFGRKNKPATKLLTPQEKAQLQAWIRENEGEK